MKSMETLRDMLCDKLDEVTTSGELNAGTLDVADKIVHAIKCIDTILAMESASYDDGSYYDGSYARGRGTNARRDSMGRYSNRYSRTDGMRGYSRHDDKEHMAEKIEDMMEEASDKETKEALRKVLHTLK